LLDAEDGVGAVQYFQVLNEDLEVLERLPAFDGRKCPGCLFTIEERSVLAGILGIVGVKWQQNKKSI